MQLDESSSMYAGELAMADRLSTLKGRLTYQDGCNVASNRCFCAG